MKPKACVTEDPGPEVSLAKWSPCTTHSDHENILSVLCQAGSSIKVNMEFNYGQLLGLYSDFNLPK